LAQGLFGLKPRHLAFVLAVFGPGIVATNRLGLAPGLLATFATMAGTYFLQHDNGFNFWRSLAVGAGIALLSSFVFGPGSHSRRLMLGWQYQRLYLLKRDPLLIWHNGGTGGYASFVGFVRETETAVVVLANSANSVDSLGVNILNLLNRPTSQGEGKLGR
jgi:CubicO group peptidase (beta-lactamase class C family)